MVNCTTSNIDIRHKGKSVKRNFIHFSGESTQSGEGYSQSSITEDHVRLQSLSLTGEPSTSFQPERGSLACQNRSSHQSYNDIINVSKLVVNEGYHLSLVDNRGCITPNLLQNNWMKTLKPVIECTPGKTIILIPFCGMQQVEYEQIHYLLMGWHTKEEVKAVFDGCIIDASLSMQEKKDAVSLFSSIALKSSLEDYDESKLKLLMDEIIYGKCQDAHVSMSVVLKSQGADNGAQVSDDLMRLKNFFVRNSRNAFLSKLGLDTYKHDTMDLLRDKLVEYAKRPKGLYNILSDYGSINKTIVVIGDASIFQMLASDSSYSALSTMVSEFPASLKKTLVFSSSYQDELLFHEKYNTWLVYSDLLHHSAISGVFDFDFFRLLKTGKVSREQIIEIGLKYQAGSSFGICHDVEQEPEQWALLPVYNLTGPLIRENPKPSVLPKVVDVINALRGDGSPVNRLLIPDSRFKVVMDRLNPMQLLTLFPMCFINPIIVDGSSAPPQKSQNSDGLVGDNGFFTTSTSSNDPSRKPGV